MSIKGREKAVAEGMKERSRREGLPTGIAESEQSGSFITSHSRDPNQYNTFTTEQFPNSKWRVETSALLHASTLYSWICSYARTQHNNYFTIVGLKFNALPSWQNIFLGAAWAHAPRLACLCSLEQQVRLPTRVVSAPVPKHASTTTVGGQFSVLFSPLTFLMFLGAER